MGTPADLSILGVVNGLGRGKTGLSRDHNCFLTSLSSAGSSSPLLQTGIKPDLSNTKAVCNDSLASQGRNVIIIDCYYGGSPATSRQQGKQLSLKGLLVIVSGVRVNSSIPAMLWEMSRMIVNRNSYNLNHQTIRVNTQ